jgi:hypothetical protein
MAARVPAVVPNEMASVFTGWMTFWEKQLEELEQIGYLLSATSSIYFALRRADVNSGRRET